MMMMVMMMMVTMTMMMMMMMMMMTMMMMMLMMMMIMLRIMLMKMRMKMLFMLWFLNKHCSSLNCEPCHCTPLRIGRSNTQLTATATLSHTRLHRLSCWFMRSSQPSLKLACLSWSRAKHFSNKRTKPQIKTKHLRSIDLVVRGPNPLLQRPSLRLRDLAFSELLPFVGSLPNPKTHSKITR